MDVPRFDSGSTGYVSFEELSDLSLYLLSYTALDVIHVFLGLLPTIFDRLYLNKVNCFVCLYHHHTYRMLSPYACRSHLNTFTSLQNYTT